MIVGYQYLKGKNIFKKSNTFYTTLSDVNNLEQAAPVKFNGMKVGAVSKIDFNPDDVQSMIITMDVDAQFSFPKDTRAVLMSGQIVGGKEVHLMFDEHCSSNCAETGSTFASVERGFIESFIGTDNIDNYEKIVRESVASAYGELKNQVENDSLSNGMGATTRDLQKTIDNLADISHNLSSLLKRSSNDLANTFSNLADVTNAIAGNQDDLTRMMSNFSTISQQIKDADISATVSKSSLLMDNANNAITSLDETMSKADQSVEKLSNILTKMDEGDGTMAKMINDKELYTNLEQTSENLSLLLQDLRLNPNRYVKVSVFGRKSKPYVKPEDDPAHEGGN